MRARWGHVREQWCSLAFGVWSRVLPAYACGRCLVRRGGVGRSRSPLVAVLLSVLAVLILLLRGVFVGRIVAVLSSHCPACGLSCAPGCRVRMWRRRTPEPGIRTWAVGTRRVSSVSATAACAVSTARSVRFWGCVHVLYARPRAPPVPAEPCLAHGVNKIVFWCEFRITRACFRIGMLIIHHNKAWLLSNSSGDDSQSTRPPGTSRATHPQG